MDYGFDRPVPARVGVETEKWDLMEPGLGPGIVPLSVADMEFASPPPSSPLWRTPPALGCGATPAGETATSTPSTAGSPPATAGRSGGSGWSR